MFSETPYGIAWDVNDNYYFLYKNEQGELEALLEYGTYNVIPLDKIKIKGEIKIFDWNIALKKS